MNLSDPTATGSFLVQATAPKDTACGTCNTPIAKGESCYEILVSPEDKTLLAFRLLPQGFDNRQLRAHLAPLLGVSVADRSAGRMTYDLRRLRVHGLIERIPRSRRYRVTTAGIRSTSHEPVPLAQRLGYDQPSGPVDTRLRSRMCR